MNESPSEAPTEGKVDIRKRRTRELIFHAALGRAEDDALDGMTMSAFAEAATVSVNTVKGHSFRTIADIANALLNEAHEFNLEPNARARQHLTATARQSIAHKKQEGLQKIREAVTRVASSVKRGTREGLQKAVEELEALYTDARATQPDQPTLLAEICNEISKIYLRHRNTFPITGEVPDPGLEWAKTGLNHLESDRRGRSFELGRSLASRASTAAHQIIITMSSALNEQSSDEQRMKVQLEVVPHLATLMTTKKQERDYAIKLNQEVRAAAAEFHRARAEALLAQSRRGEIDAAIAMARSLDQHTDTIPLDILEMFLPRLCALQIAYTDEITSAENNELDAIRPRLIGRIPAQSEANRRAMETLFALADFDRHPDTEPAKPSANFHLTDLVLVSTYGIVGRVLLADHLRRIAKSSDTNTPMYEKTELLSIGKSDYLSAARSFYETAPRGTSVLGVAAVLARRARDTLDMAENVEVREAADPEPWPILDGKGLNTALLDQFSLGAVTGARPTKEQADRLLEELRPFLDFLNSISEGDTGPAEKAS